MAMHGNPQIAGKLRGIDGRMCGVETDQDTKGYLKLNQEFHFTIFNESGNEDLGSRPSMWFNSPDGLRS
ncbi:hypothetical protein [Paracoccus niistensis]|uniref:Uncharacterized protein n=1 Tax=Paracoccus niistensis TaxID=632935 RepID=A0ABV6I3R3_9RHOB